MTRRFALALTFFIAAVTLILGSVPSAFANTTCTGVMNGAVSSTIPGFSSLKAPSTLSGNVTVPSGASCTLMFYNVTGNIQAGNGASVTLEYVNVTGNVQVTGGSLLVNAYNEPSSIGGNVQATSCSSALLEGNVTVNGNVQITGCTGSGPNGFQGPGIAIKGNFQCTSNSGGCEAWLGNVGGNVQLQGNGSGGPTDVSLDTIGGNLQCQNTPATTHAHGFDWVTGNSQGQCAGFSTNTTLLSGPTTPVASCAALASIAASSFAVPNTTITSAVDTAASGTLPERCIINGVVNARTSIVDNCTYGDSFQVQLPLAAAWNHRFMFEGGGGTEGAVPTATGTNSGSAGSNFGIINGYAVASQDGGHENTQLAKSTCDSGYGNANEFHIDPMGNIDFGYQSIDVVTLTAKYLIGAYYGQNAGYSYWVGCSTGGRQGMTMSEAFPQYFDGIVAGDPVYDLQSIQLGAIWGLQNITNVYETASPALPPLATVPGPAPEAAESILYPAFPTSDQALFETALLQACDALDGVSDGVIDNLPACKATFDPATATYVSGGVTYPLQCPGAKNSTCLSPAQIQAVKNIHDGAHTTSGAPIYAPAGAFDPDHVLNAVQGYAYDGGYMTTVGVPNRNVGTATSPPVFYISGASEFPYAFLSPPNPTFPWPNFNLNTDTGLLATSSPIITYSTSLDISKFVNYGHKIIWYHGLSDPGPPVLGTINYYTEMADQFGGLQAAQNFSRFYPVPNMDHCTGGATTDQFDMLTPLMQWVEDGTAPGPVAAKGVNFNSTTYQVSFVAGAPDNAPTTRSRPLCPYPQEARFTGSTTVVGGTPVATNPSDLANASNYECITPSPPYLQ